MRRIMTILLTLTICATCSGQKRHKCMIGTDISSLLRSHEADVFCGISIGKGWTVSAAASIRLPQHKNEDSAIHKDDLMLEDTGFHYESENLTSVRIGAQYWPDNVFYGPVISLGIGTRQSRNIECPLDIGYMCRIGKGLRVVVSYDIELTGTIRENRITGKGVCINLGYEF